MATVLIATSPIDSQNTVIKGTVKCRSLSVTDTRQRGDKQRRLLLNCISNLSVQCNCSRNKQPFLQQVITYYLLSSNFLFHLFRKSAIMQPAKVQREWMTHDCCYGCPFAAPCIGRVHANDDHDKVDLQPEYYHLPVVQQTWLQKRNWW